jgi:hypothetical protein
MTDKDQAPLQENLMSWNDQPAWQPAQPPPAWEPASYSPSAEPAVPAPPASSPVFGGIRRTIATVALAVGLLVVGGTAVVLAADPSASPAPNATTAPSGGTTTPRTHTGSSANCPNMGGSGSGGSTAPSTTGPSSSPATNL